MNIEQIKNIFTGWTNNILEQFDLLPDEIKKEFKSDAKAKICDGCYMRNLSSCDSNKEGLVEVDFKYYEEERKVGDVVRGCGCNLPSKILSHAKCPLGKFEHLYEQK